ncbi:MAG: diaminopimelate decarboxylase [Muribaculaceae bacterium]|nr:diaminopimelate decarboxylase [Muribaculaceae bacterium]
MTDIAFPINCFAELPTPFYAYSIDLLHQTLQTATNAAGPDAHIHYAVKANANPVILQKIAKAGFGADCVSGGEIEAALAAGFDAKKIVYAGVGKTDAEILRGIDAGIGCFNVESAEELEIIAALASERNKTVRVALRVNPNVDAHTHKHITTGLSENKFGINLEALQPIAERALALPSVELYGLHFHIGSQLLDMSPYAELCAKINDLQDSLSKNGIFVNSINVGGGLGVDYDDPDKNPIADFDTYFATFKNGLKLRDGQTLHFELGRSIVAQCGSLISRCIYVKHGTVKKFVILDAGMTELIRPALYSARHKIQNISATEGSPTETYDVVGPVCESSDVFVCDGLLPVTQRGDFIAIRSAGAYGEVMASNYNCRKLHPAYFIN